MAALDSDTDVSGLLTLAAEKLGGDALVSADAMLLAATLNWEQAEPALVELAEPNVAKDAWVRPIHVHTLCVIAAAKQSEPILDKLQLILGLSQHEEMREDILCAISSITDAKAAKWIKAFVEANLQGDHELDFQTALLILSKRMPPDAYRAYMTGLIDSVQDEATIALLTRYRDDTPAQGGQEPPPNAGKQYYKLWGGFQVQTRPGGATLRFGDRLEYHITY